MKIIGNKMLKKNIKKGDNKKKEKGEKKKKEENDLCHVHSMLRYRSL